MIHKHCHGLILNFQKVWDHQFSCLRDSTGLTEIYLHLYYGQILYKSYFCPNKGIINFDL